MPISQMARRAIARKAGKASWVKSGFTPARKQALKKARRAAWQKRMDEFSAGSITGTMSPRVSRGGY